MTDVQSDVQQDGKAMVREKLIARLDQAGLVRKRGSSLADHEATMKRLVDHLAYMTPDNVEVLAESLIDAQVGGIWPAEIVVRQWAQALQAAPVERPKIISSWLASVEGPKAELGGYLVELYRFLIRHKRPPLFGDLRQITDEAGENVRRLEIVQGRIDRGTVTDEDRQWHGRYMADRAAARAVVDGGRQRREGAA